MGDIYDKFRKAIERELITLNSPDMQQILSVFKTELDRLAGLGVVSLGADYILGGDALEFRVRDIFGKMGLRVEKGSRETYDAIIFPFEGLTPQKPIVIEIKSSKHPSPSRDNLRQLDDWVFELSGEEKARKEGLSGIPDAISVLSYGRLISKYTHPTPHKGVMVFNGSVEQPFESRSENWLGENEKEFAQKRNFCIISLECLISWYDSYHKDNSVSYNFWETIHSTTGVLPFYQ